MSLASVWTKIQHFFSTNSIGETVLADGKSAVDAAVAVLEQTDIGAAIAADIKTVEHGTNADGSAMTGAQKMDKVISNTVPLIVKYVVAGEPAFVGDVTDIARATAQAVFNKEASTSAGAAATAILTAAGVKVPTSTSIANG